MRCNISIYWRNEYMSKYIKDIDLSQLSDLIDEEEMELIYEQIDESDRERDRKSARKMRDYYDD